MKKLLCIPFLVFSMQMYGQIVQITRTTHLLNEPNQATFDHSQIAQSGEDIIILEYYPSEYYKVRYKLKEYYVYYPYFKDVAGINVAVTKDLSIERKHQQRSTPARTIHTGPRGGRYYINKNGNKTYIKQ